MTIPGRWTSFVGIALLVGLIAFTLVQQVFGPDPAAQDVPYRLAPPGEGRLFGTDQLGRDYASRVGWAMRGSLGVAAFVTMASGVVGGLLGVLAGMSGGRLDDLVQRAVDAVMAVPLVVIALAAVAAFGNDVWVVAVSLGVAFLPLPLRVARAAAMSIRTADYVDAARVAGAGRLRIATRHVGLNALGPWLAVVSAQAGGALLAESALSFVGAGGGQSLGALLSGEAQAFMHTAPWLAIFPGAAIVLAALSVNLLGESYTGRGLAN